MQAWAALQWRANFDSDEAIFGLMARHKLQGRPPTYMYGGRYLESEALLGAGPAYSHVLEDLSADCVEEATCRKLGRMVDR